MNAQLLAVKGRTYTKPFNLTEGGKILIGRGEDCQVQVLDPSLSRHQCEVAMQENNFTIRDMNSLNGTWVNGARIKEVGLKDGDKVQLGALGFVFRVLPERRRSPANLLATVPENAAVHVKQRLDPDQRPLLDLPDEFQSVENYKRVQRDLSTIYRIGNFIHAEKDQARLYDRILSAILEVIAADRCILLLSDPASEAGPARPKGPALVPVAAKTPGKTPLETLSFSHTVADEAFASRMCILRGNVFDDSQLACADSILRDNISSIMCAPVESPDGILGVLYVDTIGHSQVFRAHDLELLAAVGRQAGIAIRRHQLQDELRGNFFGTVRALVASMEAKDKHTKGHSDRVTRYAMQIGARLGLPSDELQTLELACLLHDVGKIGVVEGLLLKPGTLTARELETVRKHPDIGADIIRNIQRAEKIGQIVRHHHERWDGKGYPGGLRGDDIPLASRILAVADTLDAMTSHRPYRKTPGLRQVEKTLKDEQGHQFDAKIAAAALELLRKGKLKPKRSPKRR